MVVRGSQNSGTIFTRRVRLSGSLACAVELYFDRSCYFLGKIPLIQRLSNREHRVRYLTCYTSSIKQGKPTLLRFR